MLSNLPNGTQLVMEWIAAQVAFSSKVSFLTTTLNCLEKPIGSKSTSNDKQREKMISLGFYLEKRNENKFISNYIEQNLGNNHNNVLILILNPVFTGRAEI